MPDTPHKQSAETYVFPPAPLPSADVAGRAERFPIRRVICVGRNYAAHAREMGRDPDREPPFFFMKPADAVVPDRQAIPYPPLTENFHYEIELVVAIGDGGADIPSAEAESHVYGYAVGIDLTRRDLQLQARDAGRPWEWGKAFDLSAPMTAIRPATEVGHPKTGRIWLAVNDEVKQDADLSDLIWPVADVVAFASQAMRLAPGDLIFTGTPAGVGAMKPGDKVTGGVEDLGEIEIQIA